MCQMSEGQQKFMDRHKIPYTAETTGTQAGKLIRERIKLWSQKRAP